MTERDPNKNVYIVGAGFSKAASAPLMDEFFGAMQRCYFKHKAKLFPEDLEALDFALKFREETASASDNFVVRLDNLEDLFGLLEVQIVSGKKANAHRRMFIRAIVRTLELLITQASSPTSDNYISTSSGIGTYFENLFKGGHFRYAFKDGQEVWLYHVFAAMVAQSHLSHRGSRDSVITFNYDLILDRAFADVGMHVDYHNGPQFQSHAEGYSSPVQPDGGPIKPISLYKLHGSANWIRCELSPEGRYYLSSPVPANKDPIPGLLHDSMMACPYCKQARKTPDPKLHSPVIVPPTWNKGAYQAGLESVWKAAIEDLSTAGRVIVIGFSLPATDIFFRFLLTAGFPIGRGTEIFLFDPSEVVRARYADFLSPTFKERKFRPIAELSYEELPEPGVAHWHGHFNHFGLYQVARASAPRIR